MLSSAAAATLLTAVLAAPPANTELNEELLRAARAGDAKAVAAALAKGADVNAKSAYGATALSFAADKGHAEVARILVQNKADVNAKDSFYGATPITWAVMNDRPGVVKVLIEAGAVAVDGRTIRDPSHRVNAGAAIVLDVPPAEPAAPAPEPIQLKVVYEDDDIIVIDKPKNLVVHPAAGHWTGTLVNALIAHCGASLSGIGGERRPGIVHRLDKDTTGLMVAAKNDAAHRALAKQFADHGRNDEAFERTYLALAWGAPDRPHGTIDKPIDRHPKARDRMAVRHGGREAVTHWQVLERYYFVKINSLHFCGPAFLGQSLQHDRFGSVRVLDQHHNRQRAPTSLGPLLRGHLQGEETFSLYQLFRRQPHERFHQCFNLLVEG